MSIASYILGIVAAALVLLVVLEMLRRRRLRERHAVWWLLAGVLALVVGVFPPVLEWLARLLGVQVPTNLVFFVGIAILFLVCLQYAAELTRLESHTRVLAERVALVEQRLGAAGTSGSAEPPEDLARDDARSRGAQMTHDESDVVADTAADDTPSRPRPTQQDAVPRTDG